MFDDDDRQRHEIAAAAEGHFLGRQFYRRATGALMESLSYDLPMPKRKEEEPAWRSIVEPERFPAEPVPSELYDRRNGLGRHWGRAEPGVPAALPAWLEGNEGPLAAAAVLVAFHVLVGSERISA